MGSRSGRARGASSDAGRSSPPRAVVAAAVAVSVVAAAALAWRCWWSSLECDERM